MIMKALQLFPYFRGANKRPSLLGLTSYILAREGLSNNASIAFVRQGSSHSSLEHAPLHHLAIDIVVQPWEIGILVISVNHVQRWIELVSSDGDAARCWDKPVDRVCLDMASLSPLQLHLHVWLGQALVRGQVTSRPQH